MPAQRITPNAALTVQIAGLTFTNPIGLAAGFDKNAEAIPGLVKQGFGAIECGTVTPEPQRGNPRPRLFRLPEDNAVINRLGFNNHGIRAFYQNFARTKARAGTVVVGANIGKNKDTENDVSDYLIGLRKLWQVTDYITINISSPNTPNLRDIQNEERIRQFLGAIEQESRLLYAQHDKRTPLFLKIAPDMTDDSLQEVLEAAIRHNMDAVIISNTTVADKANLRSEHRAEQGGLSGAPLFSRSTQMLAKAFLITKGRIPLMGVGGISNADDAYQKIRAGASLIQLYTALVYQGFSLIPAIHTGLLERLQRDGASHLQDVIGRDAEALAKVSTLPA